MKGSRIRWDDDERLWSDRLGLGCDMWWPPLNPVPVGDHVMPGRVEVNMSAGPYDPHVEIVIRVISGVPRCTEIVITHRDDGREIRPRDLDIDLEGLVEDVSARWLGRVEPDGSIGYGMGLDPDWTQHAKRVVSKARSGSRRPVTMAELRQVAEVFNAHKVGGREAVMAVRDYSRSTADRRIRDARAAGLITRPATR